MAKTTSWWYRSYSDFGSYPNALPILALCERFEQMNDSVTSFRTSHCGIYFRLDPMNVSINTTTNVKHYTSDKYSILYKNLQSFHDYGRWTNLFQINKPSTIHIDLTLIAVITNVVLSLYLLLLV